MKKRIAAEWEPAVGVMVGYPISLPKALVQEYAKDTTLHLLCENDEAIAEARKLMEKFDINPDAVKYLTVPKGDDSTWPRDWGPQPLFREDGSFALLGPSYVLSTPFCDPGHDAELFCAPWLDEPLPIAEFEGDTSDDDAAEAIAKQLGVDFIKLPFAFTGGNALSDGVNTMLSMEVLNFENRFKGFEDEDFYAQVAEITGMSNYSIFSDYEEFSLNHVDCFLKPVSDHRLLVQRPPEGHPLRKVYDDIVEGEIIPSLNSYGEPWEIFRIDSGVLADGENIAAYINSLILNKCVYVPLYSIPEDERALECWRAALPGYDVKGFTFVLDEEPDAFNPDDLYSGIGWDPGDVLHCRSRAVWDTQMLYVRASQPSGAVLPEAPVQINATVKAYSGAALVKDAMALHYRVAGDQEWTRVALEPTNTIEVWAATIPGMPSSTTVEYYVEAADESGRNECCPPVAPVGWRTYTVA